MTLNVVLFSEPSFFGLLSLVCHVLSCVAVPSTEGGTDAYQTCGQVPLRQTGGVCFLLVRKD